MSKAYFTYTTVPKATANERSTQYERRNFASPRGYCSKRLRDWVGATKDFMFANSSSSAAIRLTRVSMHKSLQVLRPGRSRGKDCVRLQGHKLCPVRPAAC